MLELAIEVSMKNMETNIQKRVRHMQVIIIEIKKGKKDLKQLGISPHIMHIMKSNIM